MRSLRAICFLPTLLWPMLAADGQANNHNNHKVDPCDREMKFCWYGPYQDGSDEVDAWGDRWLAQDKAEKSMEISAEIRCVKKMGVCIYASSRVVFGNRRLTKIDLLPITRWDNNQITADGEDAAQEPCDRDSYLINRGDRSVTLISSPGPRADTSACTGVLGEPKTVIYRLQRD